MRWGMTVLLALVFCAATLILGGDSTLGRLSLAVGQPWLAAQFLDDPYWKGMALYRLGRFEESAAMFRTVGKPAFFNRGNALAKAGHYEEAVAYYDAALFYHPEDQDARANRNLVNALIERNGDVPLNGNFIREDAKQQEEQESAKAKALRNDYSWADKIRYTSTFLSGQSVPATEEWLESLPDDPGRYLKLRIAAEHERRQKLGTAAPAADDPW
jgi:Ca-activated chloride channel family protein